MALDQYINGSECYKYPHRPHLLRGKEGIFNIGTLIN